MNPYTVEAKQQVVNVRFTDIHAGWEQWVWLRSDAHHDSTLCDRETEYRHLNEAKARGALIVDGGDLFDAMQGAHDRRKSNEEIRPEYLTNNYFGALLKHTFEEYEPYAANWLVLAHGNHESSVTRHSNFDLTSALVDRLNQAGGNVHVGSYDGWVRFMFNVHKNVRTSVNLRYFHGAGASAPVTKGVIETNRQAVTLGNADIILNGHNHQAYIVPLKREVLGRAGGPHFEKMWFVRTPGYKFRGEWEIEKGHSPTLHGGCWLRFYIDSTKSTIRFSLTMELE